MPERADVVVVGAGDVGGCAAYLLAKEGLKVCLLDGNGIGAGSSGHGHGALTLVGRNFRPGPHFELGRLAAEAYPAFAASITEDSGIDPLYHELPGLSLAIVEEEEEIFLELMERLEGKVEMRWIDGDACREIEPRITEEAIGAVLYVHGQVDGYLLSLAAAQAVERLGGEVAFEAAIGLRKQDGRAVAVETARGRIACEHVVLAMGAWSGDARAWLGCPVPVRPLHGEVLHVQLPGDPVRAFIMTARHGPVLPRRDGLLMVGSIGGAAMRGREIDADGFDPFDERPEVFDGRPHDDSRERMIGCGIRVMPALEDATLVAHLAGVRPLSADQLPLIGPVPGLENVHLATGHGTKGIHLAPVTAQLIADYVVRGGPCLPVDAGAFAVDRFGRDDPAAAERRYAHG
jgi:glycine oxidase